jgi:hypothetical protein
MNRLIRECKPIDYFHSRKVITYLNECKIPCRIDSMFPIIAEYVSVVASLLESGYYMRYKGGNHHGYKRLWHVRSATDPTQWTHTLILTPFESIEPTICNPNLRSEHFNIRGESIHHNPNHPLTLPHSSMPLSPEASELILELDVAQAVYVSFVNKTKSRLKKLIDYPVLKTLPSQVVTDELNAIPPVPCIPPVECSFDEYNQLFREEQDEYD